MEHTRNETQDTEGTKSETSRRTFLAHSLAALGGVAALSLTGVGEASGQEDFPDFGKPKGPDDEAFWAEIRKQFIFEPGMVYLNNGGLGIPPKQVIQEVCKGYKRYSEIGARAEGELEDVIWEKVRPGLAQLVGADTNEIALTRNATEGLAAIANGIDLEPGDEVLATTHEYPSGRDAWLLRSQRYGVKLRQIRMPNPPDNPEQVVDLFRKAITPRTKVLTFCHITRGPGMLYPAKALCDLAREHGLISAVDGAQSVGMMPVNLHEMGCDLFVTSMHKWVLSPAGTGMLYVRRGLQKDFWPLIPGSGPWDDIEAGARRYESIGTHEIPVRAALAPALKLINGIGVEAIAARDRMLSDYLKAELAKMPEVHLATSMSHDLSSPGITSIEVKGWQGGILNWTLRTEYSIEASSDTTDENNFLRISTHFYNTRNEIDQCITALKAILRTV